MKIKYLFFLLFFCSCSTQKTKELYENSNQFALGFSIDQFDNCERVDVFNPWEKASDVHYSYWLVPRDQKVPDSLASRQVIRTPVQRIVCLSTTHIGFLQQLGLEEKVVGVSGKQYVSAPKLRKLIEEGKVGDVGYEQNLNYELLLDMKPDIVMAYGVSSDVATYLAKLKDLGIPVVLNAEYLEETPLGRAEWIKFVAAFFNQGKKAEQIFEQTKAAYLQMKKEAHKATHQPVVITGLPYKDNWWVPGGQSYLANLITDAGARYLWADNTQRESFVLSSENVISQSVNAEYWINCGFAQSLEAITEQDERFAIIKPLRDEKVYNNNKRMLTNGGNDVWESGVVRPDLILKDLIQIFHPEIFPNDTLYYYQKLSE